jgi:dTMP kinase
MEKKGRLIVIDGSDGSGKATQTKMLVQRLKKDGVSVRTMDFPQYGKNFFGAFIGKCITGDHGDFLTLDPHITSVLYAADRFESSAKIMRWLADGCTVIMDRYVSANQIHQGGKIFDPRKRREFLAWLDAMEYGVFRLPRPDMVIYLDVPITTSIGLLRRAQQKKQYLKEGKNDLVEQSMDYLHNARNSALWLARTQKGWHRVQCIKEGQLRTVKDIHEEVLALISQ